MKLRTLLPTLGLLAVLAGPLAAPADAAEVTPKLQVHFAPKPAGDPDGIDQHIVNFFGKAKKTLHGAFYEIREQKFVDALLAAKTRGVEVKILVDSESYYLRTGEGQYDKKKRNPFVKQLLDAKIEVKHDQGRSALMHNKFCIVDGRFVWSGSVNLTDTYATNCNNALEMESPEMAVVYEREFDKKFTKQLFGKKAPSYAEQQKVKVDGIPMQALFAPEDDPMSQILVTLNGAKKSIYFMQFAFTDSQVTTILMTKWKAKVEVGGIFDHRLYRSTGPYGDFSTLTRAGVPVQLFSGQGLFHHKAFIVDAGTPNATVITGSQNSSSNGNDNNDENVLIVKDRRVADLYLAEYKSKLHESTQVTAEAVYDKDPVAGGVMPQANIMIAANGVKIQRIKVEYPARWPLEPSSRARISVWRGGRNVTSQVGQEFYPKGFYLNNPGLLPTGALEIHFTKMKVSEIPGVYNLYVSVVPEGGQPNDFHPVKQQPTLEVKPATKPNRKKTLAAIADDANAAATALTPQPPADGKRRVSEAGAAYEALQEEVADQLGDGKLDAAAQFVEYLEGLSKQGKANVGKATSKAREIRRALRGVESDSPHAERAHQLLERLEAAAR